MSLFKIIKRSWKRFWCRHNVIWDCWLSYWGQTGYSHKVGSRSVDVMITTCPKCGKQKWAYDLRQIKANDLRNRNPEF